MATSKTVLKALGKAIGTLIFFASVCALIFVIPLVDLTSHDNMKGIFTDIFTKSLSEQGATETNVVEMYQNLTTGCQYGAIKEFNFPMGDVGNITLSCAEINATTAANLPALVGGKLFEQQWSKDFGCSFITCLKTLPGDDKLSLFLSAAPHNFLQNIMICLLISLIFSIILIAVSSKSADNALKSFGVPMIIASLPALFLKSLIYKLIPAEAAPVFGPVLDKFFVPVNVIAYIVLAIGIALVIAGFALVRIKAGRKSSKG